MKPNRRSFLSYYLDLNEEQEIGLQRQVRRMKITVVVVVVLLLALSSTGYFKEWERRQRAATLVHASGSFERAILSDGYSLVDYFGGPDVHQRWSAERLDGGEYLVSLQYVKQGPDEKSRRTYRHYWRVDLTEKRVQPTSGPVVVGK